jgi:phenylacetate-CoA ligase
MVDRELRDLALRHLDTEIHDTYSSGEAGAMAIHCPDNRHYHIQSEVVIVEILDENSRPCRPGEVGRVVVTPLYNYATPLFRYEIGDYAEAGALCPCGRGLPVLNRIMGRRRNLFTLPDGRRIWPSFNVRKLGQIVSIRRHKFVQTAPDALDVLLVTDHPIYPEQEDALTKIVVAALPIALKVAARRVPDIPRPESGKYEEFVSLVD